MATLKPTSTINYSSVEFLKGALDRLYDANLIQAYAFIHHLGEDGDKDHNHLWIAPNKAIDVKAVAEQYLTEKRLEEQPGSVYGTWKEYGCLTRWYPSEENNWLLYALHDADYLRQKGQGNDGKTPYNLSDIVCRGMDVERWYRSARCILAGSSSQVTRRVLSGETMAELLLDGVNPNTLNAISSVLRRGVGAESALYSSLILELAQRGINVLTDNAGNMILTGVEDED